MIDVPVQVKDALRDGRLRKNYRFVVLNEDGTESEIGTIDNNNLVSESVSIDERMCSGDTLKFGLCEGSSLEFQYFGLPNITGKRVQAFIDVDYGEDEPYTIPMGFFDVKKCSRQASTGIIKTTCYNKLQSEYLDAKANEIISETFIHENEVYVLDVIDTLLSDYGIDARQYEAYTHGEMRGGINSDAQNTYPAYRYTSLYTDQGAFSLGVLQDVTTITTSNNMYMCGWGNYWQYNFESGIRNTDYIKIDVDSAVDIVDATIAECIKTNFRKMSANVSVDVLWDRLQSMTGRSSAYYDKELTGYFFFVKIHFADNTTKIYGNNVKNPDGNFNDLRLLTFTNVSYVSIVLPSSISFGYEFGGDGYVKEHTTYYGSNRMELHGANREYYYYASSQDLQSHNRTIKTYETPKMPNGDEIEMYANNIFSLFTVKKLVSGYTDADLITLHPAIMGDVTLRELQSSVFETDCQFGQLSRLTDLFSGVELNRSALYPADTLYPANSLYPDGAQASSFRSQYSKLWADEGNVHKWRNLIITYKGLDENQQPKDFTLQRQVNADGTDDYNCSDNWLFRNLIWTSEQIAQYADAMVAKMQPITWFPFEMWAAGLPYLETGDQIEIPLGEETYTSYILQRQLKGIQNLQDTYINGTLDIF